MMIVLVVDKEFVTILRVLLFCFTRRSVPVLKYEVHDLPSIVEVLLFVVWPIPVH